MKILLTLIPLALLASCAETRTTSSRIHQFYQQARQRMASGATNPAPNLTGLVIEPRALPGLPRYPSIDESCIVVADPDPAVPEAVQLIVSPRISGSFLDPLNPTAEFLRQQQEDTIEAVQKHRYTGVYLLPMVAKAAKAP